MQAWQTIWDKNDFVYHEASRAEILFKHPKLIASMLATTQGTFIEKSNYTSIVLISQILV